MSEQTATEPVASALAAFGDAIGIPDLHFDEDGNCSLQIDDAIDVNLGHEPDIDRVMFSASLGEVPLEAREVVYAALLEGNLFWSGTGGATLSVEPESRQAFLHQRMPVAEVSAQSLEAMLDRFVLEVEAWTREIQSAAEEEDAHAPAPTGHDPMMWG